MIAGSMGLTGGALQTMGLGHAVAFMTVLPKLASSWGLLWGKRPAGLGCKGMAQGVARVAPKVRTSSFNAFMGGLRAIARVCLAWLLGSPLQPTR
jgi:hypothetical protein